MGWRDELSRELKEGVALVRSGDLTRPPPTARLRRVFHGAALVVGVLRTMWHHPATRQRYLQVVLPQAVAVMAAAVVFGPSLDRLPDTYSSGTGASRWEFTRGAAEFWATLYTTLCVVEWIVIALSRDFHDELSARASLLVGVPPEDSPEQPRVRLNLGWCFRKLKRRVQGMFIFAAGLPLLAVLLLVPELGDGLYSVAAAGWGFYWLATFTVGKTAYAWAEPSPRDPWFFRAWERTQAGTALLRWWLPNLFERIWRRVTGMAARPASLVERMPWESGGLALIRLLCGLPVVYLFIRPVIPVAAGYVLKEHGMLKAPQPAPP
ncbi:MAG: hypothetical protein HY904_24395 [Deltaproteobacteria bacterium]|nr:hypothetical protein [Deltaproteobacteria bacterium]